MGMDEFDVLMRAMKKQSHITIFFTKSRSPYMVSL
jgi:hypothetical protein